MSKYFKVIAVLILPPLVAFGILFAAQKGFDKKLRSGLYEAFKNQNETLTIEQLQKVNSSKFCSEPEGRQMAPEFCRDIFFINTAKTAAATGIILSVLYIIFIAFLGARAKNNREMLLKLFKPALFITAAMSILLLVISIAALLAAIFYGEVALANSYHPKLLLALAIVGIIGIYIVVKAVWQALKRPLQYTTALLLNKEEHGEIWALVEDVAHCMGARVPDNIIAGMEPTFYATEVDNEIENAQKLTGETLYLSIPFARILSKGELRSIIGHELAHFAGDDVKFTTSFYPIYAGAANAVQMFYAESSSGILAFIGLLSAKTMFAFFLNTFEEAEHGIGRERELNADKQSALKAASPQDGASALIKVHAYAPVFNEAYDKMAQGVQARKPVESFGPVFEEAVKQLSPQKAQDNLELKAMAHPTDTHPLLAQRLDNLGIKAEDILETAMKIDYQNSGAALISGYQEIEKKLTAVLNNAYTQHLQVVEAAQKSQKK